MFGRKSAEIRALITERDELKTALNMSNNAARLIAIERNGRTTIFTFERGNDVFTIETMGMLSDDVDAWRFMAGLK